MISLRKLSLSLAFAVPLAAQTPTLTFSGDFRIGHAATIRFESPGASAFVAVLGVAQSTQPWATPFGVLHIDPSLLLTVPGAMAGGVGTATLPIPRDPMLIGLRLFGQGIGVPGTFSPVDDFVLGSQFEDLAERNAADWTATADDEVSGNSVSDDEALRVVGRSSIRWDTGSGTLCAVQLPWSRHARWDVSANERLEFWVRAVNPNPFQGNGPVVRLGTGSASWFELVPDRDWLTDSTSGWVHLDVPLRGDSNWTRSAHGQPSLQQIDWLEIQADTWDYGFTIWIDGLAFTPYGVARPFAPSTHEPDVDVTFVERFPRYRRYSVDYDPVSGVPSLSPGTANEKRWPDPGELVTFRAHVKNAGSRETGPLTGTWRIDGSVVSNVGLASLPPDAQTSADLPWHWQGGRHHVSFEARLTDGSRQVTPHNDRYEFATDAMTFGFHMEQSTYDQLDATPNAFGSSSAEDWLNSQLAWMNDFFVTSTYLPFAPDGITQRVRLDRLTIVPDGWLQSGMPVDREVDGQWGFPIRSIVEYRNYQTHPDRALIHELSHQLGLMDSYRFDLEPGANLVTGTGFSAAEAGLMGGGSIAPHVGDTFYASHDVFGLNVTQGYRRGFYGEFLFAMPTTCSLLLRENGVPIANSVVRLYQKDRDTEQIDATAELVGTTDAQGRFTLPNRTVVPVTTATGLTLHANPYGQIDVVGRNGLFLVEVLAPQGTRYAFVPIWHWNVAWANGHRTTYELMLDLTP